MSSVAVSSGHARRLVETEARRSGVNMLAAIATVARRLSASPGTVWALLYRTPKRVHDVLAISLEHAVKRDLELEIGVLNVELVAIRNGVRRCDPLAVAEVEEELARLRAVLSRGSSR